MDFNTGSCLRYLREKYSTSTNVGTSDQLNNLSQEIPLRHFSMESTDGSHSSAIEHRGRAKSDPLRSTIQTQQPPIGKAHRRRKFCSSPYKTQLCKMFSETGDCTFGERCTYAHGTTNIRKLIQNPKHKTVKCRAFHTTGFCAYGNRCDFIHNENIVSDDSHSSSVYPTFSLRSPLSLASDFASNSPIIVPPPPPTIQAFTTLEDYFESLRLGPRPN